MNKVQKSFVLVFIIAIAPIFLFTVGSTVYAQQNTTTTQTPSLEILSHKIKEGQFSDNLIGQIQNNFAKKIKSVEVIATFYDAAGDIVGTANGYTNPTDLSPGMKAPFKLMLIEGVPDDLASYDLTVSWRPSGIFGEEESKVFEFSKQQAADEPQSEEEEEE